MVYIAFVIGGNVQIADYILSAFKTDICGDVQIYVPLCICCPNFQKSESKKENTITDHCNYPSARFLFIYIRGIAW